MLVSWGMPLKTVSKFSREIVEHPVVAIVMPDGCRLSARVWMPADAIREPVPAIVEHLPYRKRDGTAARDALTHPYFDGNGYASIRMDMRGNGDSEGLMEDEYTEQELQDACDVVAWAASQPWCNGNVGMMGISWGGF
jgi:putative CocE/NonD family hydrolase